MKIIIAKHSGFCFGVERAIGIVEKLATESVKTVKTYGPIIHNPQVVKELELKGINVAKSIEQINKDTDIVIRSHGVTRGELEDIKAAANEVIDATCPFVLKAHNVARRLSAEVDCIVIFGELEHPEVKGIISYIDIDYKVISDIEEIKTFEKRVSYGLLAQTTQNKLVFEKLSFKLAEKCDRLVVENTICNATDNRQIATLEIAAVADVMIVIGGHNSANSRRLYDLCKERCERSFHIETPEELDLSLFKDDDIVGLTAGASTPHEMVVKVSNYIADSRKVITG